MALQWQDDDARPVVTLPRPVAWLVAGLTWLLLVGYVVLLGVGLALGPDALDAWLREVLQ